MMEYLPIMVSLEGKIGLVVGAGTLAAGKAEQLLNVGAWVTLIAPELHPRLMPAYQQGKLTWHNRPFRDTDLDDAFIVFTTSGDASLDRHIYELAETMGKLVNVVDVPANANFIMPAIASSGPVQVAVSSAGRSPILATRLRDKINDYFMGPEIGVLAEYLGEWRPRVKATLKTFEGKRVYWQRVFQSEAPVLVKNGSREEADQILSELLEHTAIHEDELAVNVPLELTSP